MVRFDVFRCYVIGEGLCLGALVGCGLLCVGCVCPGNAWEN